MKGRRPLVIGKKVRNVMSNASMCTFEKAYGKVKIIQKRLGVAFGDGEVKVEEMGRTEET